MRTKRTFIDTFAILSIVLCASALSTSGANVRIYATAKIDGVFEFKVASGTVIGEHRASQPCYDIAPVYTQTQQVTMVVNKSYTVTLQMTSGNCILNEQGYIELLSSCYTLEGSVANGSTVTLRQNSGWELGFSSNPLTADGTSTSQASVEGPGAEAITWEYSIVSDSLGCTINATNGIIRAGDKIGTITVRAKDQNSDCEVEAELELVECGGCASGDCEFGATKVENNSIDVSISLGNGDFDQRAGFLTIKQDYPHREIYSPARLRYPYNRGAIVITNSQGIRQVRVGDGLADVVVGNTNGYAIRLFKAVDATLFTNGLYAPVNSPFAVITVTNLDSTGATTNQIRIIETRDGADTNYDFVYSGGVWELTKAGGLAKEIVTWTTNGAVRTVLREIKVGSDPAVLVETRKFETFAWGEGLVEDSVGTGAAGQTNTYSYYTNGLIQQVTRADGSWEFHIYDSQARRTNLFLPFAHQAFTTNRSLCRWIEYSYDTNLVSGSGDNGTLEKYTPRREIELVQGFEVARRYFAATPGKEQQIVCTRAGSAWNSEYNLVTTTHYFTNGFFFGQPSSVVHPDATWTHYEYAQNLNHRTNIIVVGPTNTWSGSMPETGVSNVIVAAANGQRLSNTGWKFWTVGDVTWGTNHLELFSEFDAFGRPRKITYLDEASVLQDFGCCGQTSVTNREGTVTNYEYDKLRRLISTTVAGIKSSNILDAAGNSLITLRVGTDGTKITNNTSAYDNSGRPVTSTDALGNITRYTNYVDGSGYVVRKTTFPNSATKIERYNRDGSLFDFTGTAVFPFTNTYGVELAGTNSSGGNVTNLFVKEECSFSTEWVKSYTDMAGRQYKTVFASSGANNPYRETFYQETVPAETIYGQGRIDREVDEDGTTTLYDYEWWDEAVSRITIDLNGNGSFDATDRYTDLRTHYEVWEGLSNPKTVRTGFTDFTEQKRADGLVETRSSYGRTTEIRTRYPGGGDRYVTNTAPDGSYSITRYQHGRLMSVNQYTNGVQILGTSYGYDPHGRQNTVTDARNGTTTYTFNNADQILTISTPAPDAGQSAQVTTLHYDTMGRVWRTELPDSTSTTNEYHNSGLLKKTYGSRTYPVEYAYDGQGRMTSMTTWKQYPSTGSAVTQWKYDRYRGFMTNKVYADAKGTAYTYTNSGRLLSRAWARGISTSYAYNSAGDLVRIDYSDSTPDVTNTLDQWGRPTTIHFGTNTVTFQYRTNAPYVLSETLNGIIVTNAYDALWRRITNGVVVGGSWLLTVTNHYDGASRLRVVSDGTHSATYSYLANSPLVSQILFKQGSSDRMTTTKTYDYLNRLKKIESAAGGSTISSHAYAYSPANQRTSATNAENARWIYDYDKLGQVISGKKYWNDGTPVAGQQFEYSFDDIGNRKYAASGGNEWGSGLRYANYSANNLNQYTNRTVPAAIDVLGAANPNATVTVNDNATYRKGEYFRAEVPVNNTDHVWLSLTNLGVLQDGSNPDITVTNKGDMYVPKSTHTFAYDADGNLTNDGRWVYVWDAENRLVGMTSSNLTATAAKKKLEFDYDWGSRRIAKRVYDWSGSAWQLVRNHRFAYDGWNLLTELSATNNTAIRKYVWGLDISGTGQSAGGVGGLLGFNDSVEGGHFTAYDANGNVVTLVKATDSSVSASYEYSALGDKVRANGSLAKANAFRFSTRYNDDESDLLYYGYRYYDSGAGRWLSRDDFIEELGGANLYGFVFNNPLEWIDIGGGYPWTEDDYRRFTKPYFDPSANRYRGDGGLFVTRPEFPGRTEQPLPPRPRMPGLPKGGKGDSTAGGAAGLMDLAADLFTAAERKRLIEKGRNRCRTVGPMRFNNCQCCIVFLYKAQQISGKYQWYGGFGNLVQKSCDKAEDEFRKSPSMLTPTFDSKQQPDPVFIPW